MPLGCLPKDALARHAREAKETVKGLGQGADDKAPLLWQEQPDAHSAMLDLQQTARRLVGGSPAVGEGPTASPTGGFSEQSSRRKARRRIRVRVYFGRTEFAAEDAILVAVAVVALLAVLGLISVLAPGH
jgi:hypothetical protein